MSIKKVEVYFSARDWICLATHGFSMKIGFLLEKWVLLTKMDSQHDFGRPNVSAPKRQSLVQECRGRNDWSGRVGPDRVATETGCERSANLIFVSKNGWLYEQIGFLCEKKKLGFVCEGLDLSVKNWICLSEMENSTRNLSFLKKWFFCQNIDCSATIWSFWHESVKNLIFPSKIGSSCQIDGLCAKMDDSINKLVFFVKNRFVCQGLPKIGFPYRKLSFLPKRLIGFSRTKLIFFN